MHKLLIFSSVAVLTAVAFVNTSTEAYATGIQGNAPGSEIEDSAPAVVTAGGGINVQDIGTHNGIQTLGDLISASLNRLSNELRGDNSRQTEAGQTTSGIGMGSAARNASAVSMNNALAQQGAQIAAARVDTQGRAAAACSNVTMGRSQGSAETIARQTLRELSDRSTSHASGVEGTMSENGLYDLNLQLFDIASTFCTPEGNGGADQFCTGTEPNNEHLTVATLLSRPNVGLGTETSANDAQQIDYMRKVLYGRVPINLAENLLENPTSEIRNLYIDSNRLQMGLSIGDYAFNQSEADRTVGDEANGVAPFVRQMLEEGDYVSEEVREQLTADDRMSVVAQFDAITMAQMNSNYIQDKITDSEANIATTIAFNAILTNRLLFKIWSELEVIKLATATDLTTGLERELENLNTRIDRANNR